MHATAATSVALNGGIGVDNFELIGVLAYCQAVSGHDGNNGECRTLRFPTFGASTGVIVGTLAFDADRNRVSLAFAGQSTTGKVL